MLCMAIPNKSVRLQTVVSLRSIGDESEVKYILQRIYAYFTLKK